MTLVVRGDEFVIEQVTKQLYKLIDVIKVTDLTDESQVERELVLIRVNAEPQHRAEILRTADIFRARVVDVTPLTFILEATGDQEKLEAFIELLRPMGIQEIVRTGKVAIARGPKTRARQRRAGQARATDRRSARGGLRGLGTSGAPGAPNPPGARRALGIRASSI